MSQWSNVENVDQNDFLGNFLSSNTALRTLFPAEVGLFMMEIF